jgi:tetratricopeptide (TPR) repeat protein
MRWPIAASVVAIAVHSFGDFSLRAGANALILSVLLGLLCNPHWRARSKRLVQSAPPRRSFATLATVAAALVLCVASGTKLRESLQWVRIHGGSAWLEFAPRDASAWEEVGKLLYESGFRYQAPTADAFRTAIELRPTSAGAHWLLALASPRLEVRRRAMETALFLRPSAAAWRLQYAKVLARTGEIDGALAQLEEASYFDPRINEQRYLRGEGLTPTVVQAAERGFGRALAERPGDLDLLVEMAGFYDSTRNGDSAARLWREAAIASNDWPRYGLRAAESHLRVGNREKAGELLNELTNVAPSSEAAYRHLALDVLMPERRFDEAAEVVRSGIDRGADPAPLYVTLAAVETARGAESRAREALGQAQQSGQWQPEVQYNIGKGYLQVGDLEQAGRAFERASELKPEVSWYAFMLGEARERMYDLEGALEAYRRAAALDPREAVYRQRVKRIEQLASAGDANRSRQ